MANQCEVIEEQGFFTTTPNPSFISVLTETGLHVDTVSGFRSMVLGETLTGTDVLSYIRSDIVFEVGALADSIAPRGQPSYFVMESATALDTLFPVRSYTLSEEGVVADLTFFIRFVTISEHGVVHDTATPLRHPVETLVQTGRGSDALSYVRAMVIAETATLADSLFSSRSAFIEEVLSGVDALIATGLSFEVIRESGLLSSLITQRLHAQMTVEEEGFVDADPILPGQGNGWTAATDTWGMSRYVALALNSLAPIDGELYGAGDEGLFRFGDGDDNGVPIDAGVDTAKIDLGRGQISTAGYAYIGAELEGAMIVQTTCLYKGKRETFAYLFEEWAEADDLGATRAKLGRGVEARYWTFGLRNRDGSDFYIDDFTIVTDNKSRKV